MRYLHDCYLSKDRSLTVEFLFVDLGVSRGWRAYILSPIDYGFQSSAQIDVHKFSENDEYMERLVTDFKYNNPPIGGVQRRCRDVEYVCWTKKVYSLDQMMSIASSWADITAYYIRYGGSFPEIQRKLSWEGVI